MIGAEHSGPTAQEENPLPNAGEGATTLPSGGGGEINVGSPLDLPTLGGGGSG